jgi:molecular chaperone Hsp33
MNDAIHRFLLEDLDIRGAVVQLGESWRDMLTRRNYPPAVRNLLGELAAVTAIIAGNLKSGHRMTFQLQGHGPVSMLVMDCQAIEDGPLHMRGMARGRWQHNEERSDSAVPPAPTFADDTGISDLLGDGKLVLTLYQGEGHNYQSVVPLEGDGIAAVFEHYLLQSEQQPAQLWLFADETSACGLFIQCLPGAATRDADGWNRIRQLAATLQAGELTLPPDQLLNRLFGEEAVRLFDPRPVHWHCPRDEAKVREMLISLGREEVESMLEDTGVIQVDDEICGHEYRFEQDVIDELFPSAQRTLH